MPHALRCFYGAKLWLAYITDEIFSIHAKQQISLRDIRDRFIIMANKMI